MSSKAKPSGGSAKSKKAPKGGGGESKSEDVLQAVILADSFQDRFKPFTVEKPRCLLRLANVALIDYTLEFLAMNGAQEVYIYCGSFTEQVEAHVARSRWSANDPGSPFSSVQFVRVADARSAGDVLRDLDKRSLVDGDFVLVHGDLVSNIMLDKSLVAHRKRRETSAANIMTMVLTSGGEREHRTKAKGITPVFAIDSVNKRCLHYDEMSPIQSDHYVTLDPAIPDELSTDFELRSDLIDAQIDICTPEVLALWSESFDYELPRRNFLHGVLKDWELNGKMIYADVLDSGYAARASNLQMYDAISRDVLSRWTFPFVPETNLGRGQEYDRRENGLVAATSAAMASDVAISNSIVGENTTVAAGCVLSNSIVGAGCKIGAKVTLKDCYIMDSATLGDGVRITQAIVGEDATVGDNTVVGAGSLISHGVKIGNDRTLPPNTVLSINGVDRKPLPKATDLLGSGANAGTFVDPDLAELDDEDPSTLQRSLIYTLDGANISNSSISTLASSTASDSDDEPGFLSADASLTSRSRLSSFASDDSATRTSFHADAVQGLLEALRATSGDFDSAKLEFMGLRLANDASDAMMRKAVATAFTRRAAELTTPEHGGLEPSKAADRAYTARPGASKFVSEVGVGGEEDEQIEFILALQRALLHVKTSGNDSGTSNSVAHRARLGTLLAAMLQQLYALDILEEEGILGWWEDERAADGEGMNALKDKCKVLVEWLENAEEEDDDDEDDDDDDESDED